MNINKSALQKISNGIMTWESKKARSKEEKWSYDKHEKAMSDYEDILYFAKNECGMQKIGKGRDRIAFTSGNIVNCEQNVIIKISLSDGTNQNREEIEMWKNIDKEVEKYVASIIEYDKNYKWIIQQRADQGSPPGASKTLRNNLSDIGWSCSDIRPDNIGMINDKPVLIDLGIGLRKL
jgi:hypothetical protein